jgi:hypothetical protein
MKGAIFIFGGNLNQRIKQINDILERDLEFTNLTGNVDLLEVAPEDGKRTTGVAQIRQMVKYINQKPFNHVCKAVIIPNSESMTVEAQNALLKTLEETPSYATIILSAPTKKSILPTVISRCQLITLVDNYKSVQKSHDDLANLISKGVGERLSAVETLSKEEKDTVIETLDNWISDLRNEMLQKHSSLVANQIQLIQKVKGDIQSTNLNVRLALEYLVLQL